jgi:putative ABC transport system permease protein
VALAIVTLTALGIAGVVALFGPLYSFVIAPLPLPNRDQLVRLGGRIPVFNVYTRTFENRERFQPIFAHIAVYAPTTTVLRTPGADRPVVMEALVVTPEFFETVDVAPRRGRGFASEPHDARVVVLSDRLWRSRLDGMADIVGTSVDIRGEPHTVIGVMPEGFDFPGGVDAWLPIATTSYTVTGLEAIARLRPGLSLSQASAELGALGLRPAYGPAGQFGAQGPIVQPLQTYLRGDRRTTLWALWAVSGVFLLLACVGVVNLLLANGVRRRPEMLIQAALGASQWRLVRQLLTETLLLVAAGVTAGLWLAVLAGRWLLVRLADVSAGQPFVPATTALAVSLIAGVTLIAGLAPALYATGAGAKGLPAGLSGRPGAARGSSHRGLSSRGGLAAVQVALALALLIGAGLLVRSLKAQLDVPLGLRPDGVVAFGAGIPRPPELVAAQAVYRNEGRRAASVTARGAVESHRRAYYLRNHDFVSQMRERLRAMPEVTAVGIMRPTPFGYGADLMARAFGRVSTQSGAGGPDGGEDVLAISGHVDQDGFDVLGIPMLAGRSFTEEDVANAFAAQVARIATPDAPHPPVVAIVNEGLARRLWPGEDPVGSNFNLGDPTRPYVVVGVVANFHWTSDVPSDRPAVYFPHVGDVGGSFVAKLRPEASVTAFAEAVDAHVRAFTTDTPRVEVHQLDVLVSAGQRDLRIALTLLACFATLGTVVASLGVYSASALLAASRTREVGIRMALGASASSIRRLLLSQMGRVLLSFPIGWALGWALARQLAHLLFDVTAVDLATYVTSSAVLLGALIVAGLVPVLRAGTVDPVAVLRSE